MKISFHIFSTTNNIIPDYFKLSSLFFVCLPFVFQKTNRRSYPSFNLFIISLLTTPAFPFLRDLQTQNMELILQVFPPIHPVQDNKAGYFLLS